MQVGDQPSTGVLPRLALAASAGGTVAAAIGFVQLPGILGLSASGGRFVYRGAQQSFDGSAVPTSTYGVGVAFAIAALVILLVGARRRDRWVLIIGVLSMVGAVFALYVGAHEVIRQLVPGIRTFVVPLHGRTWLDAGLWLLELATILWLWVGLRARHHARRPVTCPVGA